MLLVVGGTQTEPNYFDGLKREDAVRRIFAVAVKKRGGESPENIVTLAIEERGTLEGEDETYDEVWCALDVEGPDVRPSLDRAVRLAEQNGIQLCLSNPCFEVWIRAHFACSSQAFNDCGAVVRDVNVRWKADFGTEYVKNDRHLYERLRDRTRDAIENADRVLKEDHSTECAGQVARCNSSTDVYVLVKHLLGLDVDHAS